MIDKRPKSFHWSCLLIISKRCDMVYTGEIKNAYLLNVVDEPKIQFIYGFIVYDLAKRLKENDWIATSYLVQFKNVEDGFAAITQNSTYFVRGKVIEMNIIWDAVDNIRSGTNPDFAMQLLHNSRERNH
jgi:hypothetical protein